MKNRYFLSSAVVVAVLSIALLWGCSRKLLTVETDEGEELSLEYDKGLKIKTDKGTIDMKGNKINVKTGSDTATISIGQGSLPDNISKDIPIYKPSNVAMSQVLNGGKNVILALSTTDDGLKVRKFYEEEMNKNGWNLNRTINTKAATLLGANKGKNELNVTLKHDDDKTIISLTFQEK